MRSLHCIYTLAWLDRGPCAAAVAATGFNGHHQGKHTKRQPCCCILSPPSPVGPKDQLCCGGQLPGCEVGAQLEGLAGQRQLLNIMHLHL